MTIFQPSFLLHVADVLIVAYVIYRVLLVIRGTRAGPMLWGLAVVVAIYFLARQIGLNTLSWLLGNFLSSIILVVVVVFQDEIRRGLTKMGLHKFFSGHAKPVFDKTAEDIVLVVQKLAADGLGALIIMQRKVGLDEFLEDAIKLDAIVNRKLLYSVFVKASPLHDGAVLIEGDRIKAAGCVLPLSLDPDLDPNLGTRHRAALGLAERCDALIIVVSEENSSISVAKDGKLIRNLDVSILRDMLHRLFVFDGNHSPEHEGAEYE